MENSPERVSQKKIWFVSIVGGAMGTYFAMKSLRHQTRNPDFTFWIPIMAGVYFAIALIRGVI